MEFDKFMRLKKVTRKQLINQYKHHNLQAYFALSYIENYNSDNKLYALMMAIQLVLKYRGMV